MSTKSNETTLRAMQMTTSDTPASPLRSFFHTCRSNSNTGSDSDTDTVIDTGPDNPSGI